MNIYAERTIDVPQSPEQVFYVLSDISATPEWLERCTGLEIVTEGPLAVGSKLLYAYEDGGRSGTMDGVVSALLPNQQLTFDYEDKMMAVNVDFKIQPAGTGTTLTHSVTISPKNFVAKIIAMLFVKRALPKNIDAAMVSLRDFLENNQYETVEE